MSRIIILVVGVLTSCLTALAAEPTTQIATSSLSTTQPSVDPKTASLAEALADWVVLLEKDDLKAASIWCRDVKASDSMALRWSRLKDAHKHFNYRNWVDSKTIPAGKSTAVASVGAKQIEDAKSFKVGGSDFDELQVDWEKGNAGWRIAEVWVDLGAYTKMPAQCKLTADQATQLETKVTAMNDAITKYHEDNKEPLNKLRTEQSGALMARDTEKAKKVQAQIEEINATKFAAMRRPHIDGIMGILTADQRLKWEVFTIDQTLCDNWWNLKLTDDQKKKIDAAYEEAAAKLAKISPMKVAERDEIIQGAYKAVVDGVLTPEQRKKL